jgi:hypothetical protein
MNTVFPYPNSETHIALGGDFETVFDHEDYLIMGGFKDQVQHGLMNYAF